MKIVFLDVEKEISLIKDKESYIKNKLKNHEILFFNGELTKNNTNKIKDYEVICTFIYLKINKDILDKLPKLKLICTMGTGFDNIDIDECKKRKITVCNVPYYGENTVAEHTFALILALSRNLIKSVERVKNNNFNLNGLTGFDLKNKTLGVIGPGHIGQHVIKIANAFEMKIISHANTQDNNLAKKLNFKFVSLNELLKNSDIITIHCPLNKNTKHLINMNNIKLIKKGSYLINTARGEIVDTKALIYALDNKILAGAGLDVLEEQVLLKEGKKLIHTNLIKQSDWKIFKEDKLLLKEKNVIITPHNAFNSQEAILRIINTTIENINGFTHKKKINKVN